MLRACVLALLLMFGPVAASANARLTVLMDVLRMSEVIDILRTEGFAYAETLEADMLDGRGGAFWEAQLRQIYAEDRITEMLRSALSAALTAEQIEGAIAFFGDPVGARIIELENTVRRGMADPQIDQAARELYASQKAAGDPKADLVAEFIATNDLLASNVAAAMSANVRFYMGLAAGGYTDQSEAEIIADAWSDAEAIREDTETWLGGFLYLAYDPLEEDQLRDYIGFAKSPAGQALNAALFDGFEVFYRDISYALGRAVALNAKGDEI